MAVVLDANVAMSIVKGEKEGLAIQGLILKDEEVIAPDLFLLEVANGFWKYVHTGHMEAKVAHASYLAAKDLVTRFVRPNDLVSEIQMEAMRLDHAIYDIVYLVLARRMGATLATLDRRLMDLCDTHGVDCIELVDLPA